VIGSTARLEDFNRWYASTHLAGRSYFDALVVFAGLWQYASLVNDNFPGDWESDVGADIELARVLNGVAGSG
jgi:hypothetical protein